MKGEPKEMHWIILERKREKPAPISRNLEKIPKKPLRPKKQGSVHLISILFISVCCFFVKLIFDFFAFSPEKPK